MAWPEAIRDKNGKITGYRGRYRDAEGKARDYKENGKTKVFARKTDAKAMATEEEGKARRTPAATDGTSAPLANMTWGTFWDTIVAPKRKFPTSDRADTERNVVKLYLKPKWGDIPLNRIIFKNAARGVYDWVDDLKSGKAVGWTLDRPPAPTYVHSIYSVFNVSMKIALKEEILETSPCSGVDNLPNRPKREKPYIVPASIEKLAKHKLRVDYTDAVNFILETGLRPGELCGLHKCAIYDNGWMLVRDVFVKRRRLIRPWPKDEDMRFVPLTPLAVEIIKRRMDGRPEAGGCGLPHVDGQECDSVLVFRTERRRPMHPDTLNYALQGAAKRAGLPKGVFHGYAGRRGFATRAADGGLDPFALAAILGHESLDMVMEYVQRTPQARERLLIALGAHPQGLPTPPGVPPQLTVIPGGAVGAAVGADSTKVSVTQDQPTQAESAG